MKASTCFQTLLLSAALLSQSYGQVEMFVHEECGVEFWIPDGWDHRTEDDLLIVENPEADLKLFFLTSGIQVFGQFSEALRAEISKVILQPEVASVSEQGEHNELIYYDAQGFGLFQKEIVNWELRFLAGARNSLMIIALGNLETHRQGIEEIFQTIQLTKLDSDSKDTQ
jgi:hypothetical protein